MRMTRRNFLGSAVAAAAAAPLAKKAGVGTSVQVPTRVKLTERKESTVKGFLTQGENGFRVRYGIYSQTFEMRRISVAQLRTSLGWGIHKDADAYLGKRKLPRHYVVQLGDLIEFHRTCVPHRIGIDNVCHLHD